MTPASFTASSTLLFAAFAAARGDRRVVAYVLVVAVLAGVIAAVHRRRPLTDGVLWALSICGVLHMAGGLLPSPAHGVPVFYETWLVPGVLKYDQLTHFVVTAVVTVACWQVVARWLDSARAGRVAHAVIAGAMGVAFGALNEVFEFLAALRFTDALVGGLDNVGWDLVFNLFGAGCACLWLVLVRQPDRRRTPPPCGAPLRPGTARAATS